MVANSKDDFLFQLHNELHRIGVDADEDIFADFEEHFKASANEGLSEEETCRRLGDVKEIARNYLDIESSRINSIVAQAIEADRPHVSLTKPGHDVPADLSLVKESEKAAEPVREYTPEHFSEEIYPNAAFSNVDLSKPQESTPLPEYTPQHQSEENIPNNGQNINAGAAGTDSGTSAESAEAQAGQSGQSLSEAFGAAGRATAEAAKAAGHAIAEAFSADAVKNAGKSAAEAMKNAGQAVADAVKTGAENVKTDYDARKAECGAAEDAVPYPNDEIRNCSSDSRQGDIPPQTCPPVGSGNGFKFSDLKGRKANPSFGKLFGCICLDVFLWWWLLPTVASLIIWLFCTVVIGLGSAGFSQLGNDYFHVLSRIFLCSGMVSGAVVLGCACVGLVKAYIHWIKSIVISHIKAIYNL